MLSVLFGISKFLEKMFKHLFKNLKGSSEETSESSNNSQVKSSTSSAVIISGPIAAIPEPKQTLQVSDETQLGFSTLAICSDRKVEKSCDLAPPLHLSTTFSLDSDINDGNIYSRVRK